MEALMGVGGIELGIEGNSLSVDRHVIESLEPGPGPNGQFKGETAKRNVGMAEREVNQTRSH